MVPTVCPDVSRWSGWTSGRHAAPAHPLAAARIAFSMLGCSRTGGPSERAVKRDDGEDKTFAAVAARLSRVTETRASPAAINTKNEAPPSSDDEDDAGPLVSFAKTTSKWSSPPSLLPLVVAPEGRGRATGALRSSRSRGTADAVCQATPSALPRCSSSASAPSSRNDGPGCDVTAKSSRLPARGLRVEPTREETAGRGAGVREKEEGRVARGTSGQTVRTSGQICPDGKHRAYVIPKSRCCET